MDALAASRFVQQQPFVLYRTELQRQVLGAGYRSLPTYSVDEWIRLQQRHGALPTPPPPEQPLVFGSRADDAPCALHYITLHFGIALHCIR